MSHRPKLIQAPFLLVHQNLLRLKLATIQALLRDNEVVDYGELRLGCEIALLDVVLDRGVVNTDQFLIVFLEANPDFRPFIDGDPAIFDQACQNVHAWCHELST